MKKLETLGFKHFCMSIGNLPSSYVESLSYYECLLWLIKYLQEEVIPTVNNNSEVVEELQGLYLELKSYVDNYFDNLDVQEEINNKLDKMVEDGVLEQIIEQYLNPTALWCYDTVADMKNADNLINGSFVKTMGYYSVNDGGTAVYKITNTASETDYQEELNSGLYATLITVNKINVKQFGAVGDGTTDDTTALQTAINTGKEVFIPKGTYAISEPLNITSYKSITGEYANSSGSTIKAIKSMSSMLEMNQPVNSVTTSYIDGICLDGNNLAEIGINAIYLTNGTEIRNVKIEKTVEVGMYLSKAWFCYLSNITIVTTKIGLKVDSVAEAVNGVVYDKFFINNCSKNSVSLSGGNSHMFNGCVFERAGETNVLIDSIGCAVTLNSCHIEDNASYSIRVTNSTKGSLNLIGGNISHNDNATPIIDVSAITTLAIYGTHLACWNNTTPDYYVVSLATKNYFNGFYSGIPSVGTVSYTGYAEGNFGTDYRQTFENYTHSKLTTKDLLLVEKKPYGTAIDTNFEMGTTDLAVVDNGTNYRYGFKIDGASGWNKKFMMYAKKRNGNSFDLVPIFTCDKDGAINPKRIGIPTTEPSSPFIGEVYFNTTSNKPLYWNGTAWVDSTGNPV